MVDDIHITADGTVVQGPRPAGVAPGPIAPASSGAPVVPPSAPSVLTPDEFTMGGHTPFTIGEAEPGAPESPDHAQPWANLPVVVEQMQAMPEDLRGPVWSAMQEVAQMFRGTASPSEDATEVEMERRWGPMVDQKYAFIEFSYALLPDRWQQDLIAQRPGKGRLFDHPAVLEHLAAWGESGWRRGR